MRRLRRSTDGGVVLFAIARARRMALRQGIAYGYVTCGQEGEAIVVKAMTTVQARPAGRPRGRPKAESRLEEVLTVAATSFASRGYALTTLEDIAADLGMTRPALYYYAKSKEDLLSQCFDWTYKLFQERVASLGKDGSGRDRLARFFIAYSEVVCDEVTRCILSTETHYLMPQRQRARIGRVREINNMVAELLEEGAADGSLAPCDKKYVIATMFAAFNSLPRLLRPGGPSPARMGAAMLDVFLDGLRPRLGS